MDQGPMDHNRALILDAVADLVVRRDAEGRIVYVNAAFRRALGGELAELVPRGQAVRHGLLRERRRRRAAGPGAAPPLPLGRRRVAPRRRRRGDVAQTRGVPAGQTVISPPSHSAFDSPRGLCEFIAELRQLSGGKPVGFKLCVGARREFLSICKAIRATGVSPDFIIVDGAEGGTGAGPLEFEDHVGMPLTEGLMLVHNALVGSGLREQVRIGASGKVALGSDIVKRVIQGADFTLAARAMMFAVGCIQAQLCHTNHCPVGVTTQDPRRARALHVPDKSVRVYNFQRSTVGSALQIVASMGLDGFDELTPAMLNRRVATHRTNTYAELHQWLTPGVLLDNPPEGWRHDWDRADAERF